MNIGFLGCRKFGKLLNEQSDRELSDQEIRFLEKHRSVCASCCKEEEAESFALNLLRDSAMDAWTTPQFEDRVIRKLKVQRVKESLGYWSPAMVGGLLACLAVFAALHTLSLSKDLAKAKIPGGEARREVGPGPKLELTSVPTFVK